MKKFIKGMIVGGALSAGIVWMYSETGNMNTKKMMKKGKKFLKEIGM